VRPPDPLQTIPARFTVPPPPVATLAVAASIEDACTSVLQTIRQQVPSAIAVPDPRPGCEPASELVARFIATQEITPKIDLGLPSSTATSTAAQLRRLAQRSGIQAHELGDGGWYRLTVGPPGAILPYIDLPVEIQNAPSVVLMTSPTGDRGCADAWKDIVHPNTALRAASAGIDGVMELSAWVNACYLVSMSVGSLKCVFWTVSALEAELLLIASRRLLELRRGTEAEGPWEDARVQRIVSLQIDRPGITDIILRIVPTGHDAGTWVRALAEQVNGRVEFAPS
jgi:hypothetical protein